MTITEINMLVDKAVGRKDGIYSYRNNYWVVKNERFIAYADPYGTCYMRMGAFNSIIGEVEPYKRRDALAKWLKSQ